MHPNWYADPWNPAALRWWDGTQWTPHTAPRPWPATVYLAPDLAGTAKWAGRARAAVAAYAVSVCVEVLIACTFLHGFVHDFVHQIRQFNNQVDTNPNAQLHLHLHVHLGQIVAFYLASLVGLAAQILFIVWLSKAANTAERLGLPHRRDPVWAIVGFLIPIVNFWFPYQVAADLLPPGDPKRSVAGWWWGLYLAQSVLAIPFLIAAFASTTVAVIVGIAFCMLPLAAAVKAREMIVAVTDRHAAIAAG